MQEIEATAILSEQTFYTSVMTEYSPSFGRPTLRWAAQFRPEDRTVKTFLALLFKGEICMKKIVVALGCAAFMSGSFAQSAPPVQEITKQIVRSVTGYANAISCPGVKVDPKQIAALVPYKTMDDRMDAKYAVLWVGDIGCAGGSGTEGTNLSIVTISTGDSYVVDPLQSSPVIQFESPVRGIERIVGNTRDSLILEGMEYGPKDPNCCPSIRVRFTLRVDEKGNWKLVEKKAMSSKK